MSGPRRTATVAVLVALVAAGVVIGVIVTSRPIATTPAAAVPPPGSPRQVAALVASSVNIERADATVLRAVANADNDTFAVEFHMPPGTICDRPTQCVYGDRTGTRTLVLYGDSHARQWLPALATIARERRDRLVLLGQNGCPVVTMDFAGTTYLPSCVTTQRTSLRVIAALHPATVIVADSTNDHEFTKAQWTAGLDRTLTSLLALHLRVVVLQDPTVFTASPPVCVSQHPNAIQTACAVDNPNPGDPILATAEQAAAAASHVPYIWTDQWFCTPTRCSPVVGNFLTHFDVSHITASYATYLTTVLGDALAPYLGP